MKRSHPYDVMGRITVLIALIILSGCASAPVAPAPSVTPPPSPTPFICPVTVPNGKVPPFEDAPTPDVLGNDEGTLWAGLWPDGKVVFTPDGPGGIEWDGALGMKFYWWRQPGGAKLTLQGRRLDGDAPPMRAEIPDGYSGAFQATGLIFPKTGCWEVTGRVNDTHLTFVTEVVVDCPVNTSGLKGQWLKLCGG